MNEKSEGLSTPESFNVLLERRMDDSPFCDDAGKILVRRDIKSGVVDLHADRSHLHSLYVGDLGCFTLLDGNGRSIGDGEVDGGDGYYAVKRYPVCFADDREGEGPQLVCDIPVGCDTVAPEYDQVDLSISDEDRGGTVDNELGWNLGFHQLPSGEPGSMEPRPCLI